MSVRAGVASRLEVAIQVRDVTANALAVLVEGAQGARSPDSIRAYLSGKTSPPLDFLEAVAGALGLSLAWLAAGVGKLDDRDVEDVPPTWAGLTVGRAAREGMREHVPYDRLGKTAFDALWETVHHYYRISEEGIPRSTAELEERLDWAARLVGRMLTAPVEVAGHSIEEVTPIELDRYVIDACRAFLWLLPQDELRRSLLRDSTWHLQPEVVHPPAGASARTVSDTA